MEIQTRAAEGGTVGGAGPRGLRLLSWFGFPECLHPDFPLFAFHILSSSCLGFCLGLLPRSPHTSLLGEEFQVRQKLGSSETPRSPSRPSPFPGRPGRKGRRKLSRLGCSHPGRVPSAGDADTAHHWPPPRFSVSHRAYKQHQQGGGYFFLGPPLVISFPLPTPLL